MSTLRGLSLISATVTIPPAGGWFASCVISQGNAPDPGAADLVIGDLTLRGTIPEGRAGVDTPDAPACIVIGGNGWNTLLAQEGAYNAPGGVRLSTVLRDLAALAGEAYVAPAEVRLPESWGWPASSSAYPVRARSVLSALVKRGAIPTWRVDPATGRTRFNEWPVIGACDGRAQIVNRDLRRGIRYLALDGSVAAILPGATIEGATIRRVTITDNAGALKAETWDA